MWSCIKTWLKNLVTKPQSCSAQGCGWEKVFFLEFRFYWILVWWHFQIAPWTLGLSNFGWGGFLNKELCVLFFRAFCLDLANLTGALSLSRRPNFTSRHEMRWLKSTSPSRLLDRSLPALLGLFHFLFSVRSSVSQTSLDLGTKKKAKCERW